MARGPAYPYINLEDAVGLAQKLYHFAKRSPANSVTVLKESWEYSPTSSSASKVLAAMSYFGLTEPAPSQLGDKQDQIRITDRAYRILVDMLDSAERKQAIRDAFLAPKAYKLCWDIWGSEPPPSMRSTLLFEHRFIDSTVDQFITNYKKSLLYADMAQLGDADPAKHNEKSGESSGNEVDKSPLGDSQSNSSLERVGGEGGQQKNPSLTSPAFLDRRPGMRQEIFSLAEGDVTISWPESLSAESFEDFNDWVSILLRKVKRNSQSKEDKPQES